MSECHTWILALYDVALAFGGPEEGGWWFDEGQHVRIVRTFPISDQAYAYARKLNRRLESRKLGPNLGKREKSSAASDGVYEVHVYQYSAPPHFPEHRPHYE